MNLNITKSIVSKVEHDQWGVEKEHATAKSNTGLSLAQSTKRPFLSFSLVCRSRLPLPHNDRRYRFMTISGNRTGTTAGSALHISTHWDLSCSRFILEEWEISTRWNVPEWEISTGWDMPNCWHIYKYRNVHRLITMAKKKFCRDFWTTKNGSKYQPIWIKI